MPTDQEIKKEYKEIIGKYLNIKEALIDHFTPSNFLKISVEKELTTLNLP